MRFAASFVGRASLLWLAGFVLLGAYAGTAQQVQRRTSASAQNQPHAPTPYVITGTVVSSADGSTVPHCHLTVGAVVRGSFANRQFPAGRDVYDCDEHGHFSVPLPSAGTWRVTASGPGFVTQAYEEHEQFSSAIILTAAKPSMDLQFRINPEAAITGVVIDEAGEAVRTAQVSLQSVPAAVPGGVSLPGRTQQTTRTDDRGMYEFANIGPGTYRISVHAQPWYAAGTQSGVQPSASATPIDPSLDVTYPVAWFPGVDDPAQAEIITLHPGDARQADFHLVPIPSVHLRIMPPPGPIAANGRTVPFFPMVQQIIPGSGSPNFVQVSIHTNAQGEVDVGGLAPGVYQVLLQGPNQEGRSSIVEVTAGSAKTLDFGAATDEAKVTLHFEGLSDSDSRPVPVSLIDTATGMGSFSSNAMGGGMGDLRRRGGRESNAEPTMEVPPGRYEVVLQSRPDLYLTGMTAKGAEVAGRYVTLPSGASTLSLHIASGRSTVRGVVSFQGKPSIGAMILLVPTTIDDPNSLRILRRDQTNTDGGYDLADVIPGQYILVAIDHGWQINWSDPATLRRYLGQGVPVELTSGANVKQDLSARAP
jgi:Carboxypeptidase regulatory-like domain